MSASAELPLEWAKAELPSERVSAKSGHPSQRALTKAGLPSEQTSARVELLSGQAQAVEVELPALLLEQMSAVLHSEAMFEALSPESTFKALLPLKPMFEALHPVSAVLPLEPVWMSMLPCSLSSSVSWGGPPPSRRVSGPVVIFCAAGRIEGSQTDAGPTACLPGPGDVPKAPEPAQPYPTPTTKNYRSESWAETPWGRVGCMPVRFSVRWSTRLEKPR